MVPENEERDLEKGPALSLILHFPFSYSLFSHFPFSILHSPLPPRFTGLPLAEVDRCRTGGVVDADARVFVPLLVLDVEREVLGIHRLPLLTPEPLLVGREDRHVLARALHRQLVVGNRGRGVPVEDEEQPSVREDHRLVLWFQA